MSLKKRTFCIVNKVFAFFDSESVMHIICIFRGCYYFLFMCMYMCVVVCGARATENCEPHPNTGAGN